MIRAHLTDGSILLGLSRQNIERLLDGKPIRSNPPEAQPTILIMFGETEATIVEDLRRLGLLEPDVDPRPAYPEKH